MLLELEPVVAGAGAVVAGAAGAVVVGGLVVALLC